MIRFALGLILPYIGIVLWQSYEWNISITTAYFWNGMTGPGVGFGAAILTAVSIAIVLNHRRPRRAFSRVHRRFASAIFAGAFVSVLTVLTAIPAVVFGSDRAPDWVLLPASTLLPTIFVLWMCKKIVPGNCVACGFDLRASLDTGRCPECGRGFADGKAS